MSNQSVHIHKWLLPLSWLYGLIVFFRNRFFKWGILKSERFDVPVICIGNLTVGGTGKTPHTEYLIELLQDKYKVAVLSRGYKRKTKGFILATEQSSCDEIGDEPFQIKRKYPNAYVAVDEDRRRGIHKLLELETPPDVILLDDAFQHRYVEPSYTIILNNYFRPINKDYLLPAGRLREPRHYLSKANMIVTTKCPEDLKPIDYRILTHEANSFPYQQLVFTGYTYKNLFRVFKQNDDKDSLKLSYLKGKEVLLVTGIASPKMIIDELSKYTKTVEVMQFGDHHNFNKADIKAIHNRFGEMLSKDKIMLVTEKDAARLLQRTDISEDVKNSLYSLPIQIKFMDSESEDTFNEHILDHVRKNTRNRKLHKK